MPFGKIDVVHGNLLAVARASALSRQRGHCKDFADSGIGAAASELQAATCLARLR